MKNKDQTPQKRPAIRSWFGVSIFGAFLSALLFWMGYTFVDGSNSPSKPSQIVLSENKGHLFVSPDDLAKLRISHTFALTNTTREPWELKFTGSSCGCTKPTFGEEVLKPGDTTDLTVTIDAAGRTGHLAEYVEIKTNATEVQRIRGYLQADVHPRLLLAGIPSTPIAVPMGGRKSVTLEVRAEETIQEERRHPELMTTTSETCEANLGTPIVTSIENVARLTRCPLTVNLVSPAVVTDSDFSLRSQQIDVKFGSYQIAKNIVWRVVSPIEAQPRVVFLQSADEGNASRKLVLTSDSEFSIRSFEVSSTSLNVEVETGVRRKLHTATVSLQATTPVTEGQRFEAQKILFITDHPQQQEASVVVRFMSAQDKLTR